MRFRKISVYLLISLNFFAGCTNERVYAPVTDLATIEKIPKNGVHIVHQKETLYSISWRYGLDYRELVAINHISSPEHIHIGQQIRLRKKIVQPAISKPAIKKIERYPIDSGTPTWLWPAKGPLVAFYSSSNRGINIAGPKGASVLATAAGRVVYAGNGLRGYGNLIIVKHNNAWLSAYAWNQKMLVHEGQSVKSGQKIATIGSIAHQSPMLHFEMRHNGKPVNPLRYLQKR